VLGEVGGQGGTKGPEHLGPDKVRGIGIGGRLGQEGCRPRPRPVPPDEIAFPEALRERGKEV
jgi:hypothetical protein